MKEKASFASLTKYGLMFGIVLIIIALLKIVVGENIPRAVSLLFSLLRLAVYIIFVYLAVKKARETIYFDNYKTGKGIKVGLYTGLIAGIIVMLYNYIDILFIRPEFYEALFQQQLLMMEDNVMGVDPEAFYGMVKTMNHPLFISFGSFFTTFIGTAIVSLFVSPFFKNATSQPVAHEPVYDAAEIEKAEVGEDTTEENISENTGTEMKEEENEGQAYQD